MNPKKLARAILYPPFVIPLLLLPISLGFLVYAALTLGSEHPVTIVSYVLSAYTLTLWCFRIPFLIRFFRTFKEENRYVVRWREDDRLRMNISLHGSLVWNLTYAVFQVWLGIYHGTFWFASIGCYYFCLAVMRYFLARYTRGHRAGELMRAELVRYRACGWIFLLMNLALALIVFFMVYWNRTFHHHEITTIAMAAYTFTAFVLAVVNLVKYRKYQSPVYSASKAISLTAACVSMLTLESTMLTTWGEGESPLFRRLMLAATGAAVLIFVITMAVYMIVQGSRGLKRLKEEEQKTTP